MAERERVEITIPEKLNELEEIYDASKEELHRRLIDYAQLELNLLDGLPFGLKRIRGRVKAALKEIPRHKHVPCEYFLKEKSPMEVLNEVYLGKILPLDEDRLEMLMDGQLFAVGIDVAYKDLSEEDRVVCDVYWRPKVISTASQVAVVDLSTAAVLPNLRTRLTKRGELRSLEIGSGLGYQAAILNSLGYRVIGLEIKPYLAEKANKISVEQGYEGIEFVAADGSQGYPDQAPYDAIVVSVAVDNQEVVGVLKDQLAIGGKLVLPEKNFGRIIVEKVAGRDIQFSADAQMLRVYTRVAEQSFRCKDITMVDFSPIRGWDFNL